MGKAAVNRGDRGVERCAWGGYEGEEECVEKQGGMKKEAVIQAG